MAKRPSQSKRPNKKQRAAIREIKAKGYSASYEKRLIRGIQAGKSRQEARGHVAGEAARRREYQREQNEGLTNNQTQSIRNWYTNHFNPHGKKTDPDVEDVLDFARAEGIEKFREYQKAWNAMRRAYLREQASGKYESRGEGYLQLMSSQIGFDGDQGVEWLYYH